MRALVSWMLGRVRRARERSSRRGLGVDGAMEWGLVAVGGDRGFELFIEMWVWLALGGGSTTRRAGFNGCCGDMMDLLYAKYPLMCGEK